MNFVREMKYSVIAISAFMATLSTTNISQASDGKPSYLTGYVGYFDVVRLDHDAVQFGIEYRAHTLQYNIRPIVGVNVTNESSVYGYAGFNWDVELLKDQLYLIPNFAVGFYKKGDGRDLGGTVEFRSGIELDYQLPNDHRIGAAFNHISNAGFYKHNPGSETALINYSIPLN